jgi:hypothetical protein
MKTDRLPKIIEWSIKHPILRNIIKWLFSPIIFPLSYFGMKFLTKVFFKQLDEVIKSNNEHAILQACSSYIRSKTEQNKWKAKINFKWFVWTMDKKIKYIYDYAITDKEKMPLNYFRTLMDVYLTYNIIGGATMSTEGSTTIKIK